MTALGHSYSNMNKVGYKKNTNEENLVLKKLGTMHKKYAFFSKFRF